MGRIQIVAIAVSLVLLVGVLELVRRRKLTEEYSFLWIICALALVILSVRRDLLDASAQWLGVYYPPAVLVLLLIVTVFVASLCFSVILSRQRQQIERLVEETAILAAELRDERSVRSHAEGRTMAASAAGVARRGALEFGAHPRPRPAGVPRSAPMVRRPAPPAHTHALAHPLGLVWTLVRTDFKTRYQPTFGGFLWALMKPAAMFLVLYAVFSFLFGSEPAYRLNLIIGLILWDFFAEATKTGIVALHAKGYLLNKAKFPAWILVVTSASNALLTLAVFCVVILASLVFAGRGPSAVALLLFGWYLLQYGLIVCGVSLAGSVLFPRYRDLNQVWDVVTQAGFFIAPIIYPLSIMPERFHLLLYTWPPTPIIQFSRAVLVDGTIPTLKAHLLLATESAAILGIGILIYRAFQPRVAEYL